MESVLIRRLTQFVSFSFATVPPDDGARTLLPLHIPFGPSLSLLAPPGIRFNNVHKAFGDNQVLRGFTLDVNEGETMVIIGYSGTGKSVAIKHIVGLLDPDEGDVIYDGRNFCKMGNYERRKQRQEIGMLFQGGALFDSLTVEQNVMFPLNMFTRMTPAEKIDRVKSCLERVNLEGRNKLMPSELSGGMIKRVAIARKNQPTY